MSRRVSGGRRGKAGEVISPSPRSDGSCLGRFPEEEDEGRDKPVPTAPADPADPPVDPGKPMNPG